MAHDATALDATCPACGQVVSPWPLDAWCPQCGGARPAPDHTLWPVALKRWMTERILARQFAPHGGLHDNHAWHHMLAMELRGTGHTLESGRIVHFGFAASPDDVFSVAMGLATKAHAQREAAKAARRGPQNPATAPGAPDAP